jgi:hypothetical protein
MIIATLQTNSALTPTLSVHGGIIKLDMGALLLEMDTETFKTMMADLVTQAAKNEIHILVWK